MKTVKTAVATFLCFAVLFAFISTPTFSAEAKRVGIESGVNIRSAPGTGSTVIACTSRYTEGVLIKEDTSTGSLWYYIRTDAGTVGYVSSDFAEVFPNDPSERYDASSRIMITESVNVRPGPSVYSGEPIATLWPCSVKCTGKVQSGSETWYGIVTPGGLNGYVRSDFADEYKYTYDAVFEQSLLQFPVNYREGLRYLHTKHPNWVFCADTLPITLNYAVSNEVGKKLLSNSYTSLPESWRTTTGRTPEPGYRWASATAIRYFMSPENFIAPKSVFMFMQQSYNSSLQSKEGVEGIVNGTFLNTSDYIGMIMEAATQSGVSPYVLAGTVIQEQGYYGSALCFGTYPGYEGYYNFFNFGASGASETEIIESGLSFAMSKGWNSPRTAIIEGAKLYGQSYVGQNQDTYYYKDFNVRNQNWGYQYATNIHDQINNALYVSEAYSSDSSYAVFRIPVYYGSDFNGETQHDHSFDTGTVILSPQIGIPGLKLYKCTGCGHQKIELIPAIDPEHPTAKKGDINGDGEINSIDGARLRMHFLSVKPLSESEKYAADINGDNAVNTVDGALLRMHFLGIKPLE